MEEKVKELEEQLIKNKSKMKSQKVQLEQFRKAQKARDIEEEGAKGKTEVRITFVLSVSQRSGGFSSSLRGYAIVLGVTKAQKTYFALSRSKNMCLGLQMASIEIDCNLKKIGHYLTFNALCLEKLAKT